MSADVLLLLGPPFGLLAVGVAACLWLHIGERSRHRRRNEVLAALQLPKEKIGPPPDGVRG